MINNEQVMNELIKLKQQTKRIRKKRFYKSKLDKYHDQILALYRAGVTKAEIHRWLKKNRVNVVWTTVHRWLLKHA